MDHLLYKALEALQKGQNCACATIIETTSQGTPRKPGAKMLVFADGSQFGTIGGGLIEEKTKGEALKALKKRKTALVDYTLKKSEKALCGGNIKVFIEPFLASKELIICGGGHIGLSLSIIGKMLNFKVTVLDNRKNLANKKRLPHVDKIVIGDYSKNLSKLKFDPNSYVVIVTQAHDSDFSCLKILVKSDAAYIGVIASQAKKAKFLKNLKALKTTSKALKKVHMPTGLDIGAQTPQEIAVSIMAQIIAQVNKNSIGTIKFK
ncbi:MAG: XdhC/CoxI family protein [Candidatus Aceula meridiana]|nr:XdhC/CoxI family protein [Candidatus Aceula meridiana]